MPASQFNHRWDVTTEEAIAIQQALRHHIVQADRSGEVHSVAGVDVGFEQDGQITRAAVAVLSWPELQTIETALLRCPTRFPYIPGLLSFREAPAVLQALDQLSNMPDLLLCDGQGIAHPRRLGIACHLGLLCDLPAIGVAKSILVGRHATLGNERGDRQPLIDHDEVVGAVLRTRAGVRPVYVSSGHWISLETAVNFVLSCTPKYRLPEPIRQAHHLASNLKE